jgi:hypothetical protein
LARAENGLVRAAVAAPLATAAWQALSGLALCRAALPDARHYLAAAAAADALSADVAAAWTTLAKRFGGGGDNGTSNGTVDGDSDRVGGSGAATGVDGGDGGDGAGTGTRKRKRVTDQF